MGKVKPGKKTAAETRGRPPLPHGKARKHVVTLKFSDAELELVNWAATDDGNDRRANWIKRMALKAARRRRERAEAAGTESPIQQ